MRLKIAAVWAFVLASGAPTAFAKNLATHFFYNGSFDYIVGRDALATVDRQLKHEKRSPPSEQTGSTIEMRAEDTGADSASGFNEAAFNASATQACNSALGRMTGVVNPSGIVACYNIPFYDNATGVFQTDVRLYQMSQPVDEFAGTSPDDYMLSVSIPQAALSSPQTLAKGPSIQNEAASGGTIKMLTNFQNIGQLTDNLVMSKLTESDLRVLMIPNITLTATNPATSNMVTTTLSSDTLSYVAGELVQSNGTPTNITVPEANSLSTAIVASASKFVLPGTKISIFPTGLIVTSVWTLLFILTVGLGTIERYRFRQHYRQRKQRAQASASGSRGI